MTKVRRSYVYGTVLVLAVFAAGSAWMSHTTVATATGASWNPAVSCMPVVTTIQAIVGTQTNAQGGATQAGGWYGGQSIPSKTALTPPCTVNGAPMFVELHDVNVEGMTCNSFSGDDGDCWGNVWDNSSDTMTYLNQIHIEIAGTWITAGTAPKVPGTNTQIDIQGFVYWDDGHTGDAWHSYSGWELHPVSAWRATLTNDFSMSMSPTSGAVTGGSSTPANVTTSVTGGSAQQLTLSATGLPAGTTATFNPSSVLAGRSSVVTIAPSGSTPPGTYQVSVTASGPSATHTSRYTLTVNGAASTAITNGGFESGSLANWSTAGTASVTTTSPHTGNYAALVGSTAPTNGDSSVTQSFSAPSGGGALTFWYYITCPDAVAYDWATAVLQDNTTGIATTPLPHTCPNASSWKSVSATLTGGHYYTLALVSHDDNYAGDATYTKYDDVAIQASGGSLGTPTGLAANPVSQTQVNLSWTAVSGATGYGVQRSPDGTTGWTTIATPTATSYSDTGLTAATTYYYRVVATNGSTTSSPSTTVSASTWPNPPAAPTSLMATAAGTTEIDLSWAASAGATSYRVERSNDGTTGWTAIATPSAPSTTYQDLSVAAGSTLYYRVFAVNLGGGSPPSPVAAATCPPGTPGGVTANTPNPATIAVTWTAVSGATGYRVDRSPDGVSNWAPIGTTSQGTTTYSDSNLPAGATYYYRVAATNAGGASPASGAVSAATPPATPTGLSATAGSANSIDLQWGDVSGETGFLLERSTDGTTWSNLVTTAAGVTAYSDTGLTAGSTYYYRVSALGAGGSSAPSAAVSATAVAGTLPPPTGVTATAASTTQINVGWNAVASATGYRVERSADGSTGWTAVGSTATGATTYQDTNLTAGTAYYYRVFATSSSGDSAASTVVSATTLPQAPAAPANPSATADSPTQITVGWSDVTGATGFQVQRSANGTDGWATVGTTGQSVTTFSDSGLSPATTYYYRVIATNGGGSSSPSTVVSATTPTGAPSAPQSPRAAALSPNSISVMWQGVAAATGFQVQRSPDGVGTWATIGTPGQGATSYTDVGLQPGTPYWYRVIATNASGASQSSAVVSATTNVQPCPCSLWSPTAAPAVAASTDTSANEMGLKFRSDVSGVITGLRFYKGTTNTGTHVGHLWSRTGTLLASATFAGETPSGWQQVSFTTPVAATAGTTYVASYYAPAGHYSVDQNYFATRGTDAGPLHALANGVDGANGVYRQGASGFPTYTYRSSNYWVDVVFSASTPAAPASASASAQPAGQITVGWAAVTGATSYAISYSPDGVSGWTVIGSAGAGTTTWVDIAPRLGSPDYYRVTAVGWGGTSPPSNVVSATPTG